MKKVIVLLRDKPAGLPARSNARSTAVRAEVGPIARVLRAQGARHVTAGTAFPFVIASVNAVQEAALKQNSAVKAVFPDSVIPAPTTGLSQADQLFPPTVPSSPNSSAATVWSICGTAASPEKRSGGAQCDQREEPVV